MVIFVPISKQQYSIKNLLQEEAGIILNAFSPATLISNGTSTLKHESTYAHPPDRVTNK